eukprot:5180318-Prymnesium_polylepis.1
MQVGRRGSERGWGLGVMHRAGGGAGGGAVWALGRGVEVEAAFAGMLRPAMSPEPCSSPINHRVPNE